MFFLLLIYLYIMYFNLIFHHSTLINFSVLSLKLKKRDRVNRGDKTKRKVWKDANEVVKASIVPRKLKWYEREMLVVPKGEKASNK